MENELILPCLCGFVMSLIASSAQASARTNIQSAMAASALAQVRITTRTTNVREACDGCDACDGFTKLTCNKKK